MSKPMLWLFIWLVNLFASQSNWWHDTFEWSAMCGQVKDALRCWCNLLNVEHMCILSQFSFDNRSALLFSHFLTLNYLLDDSSLSLLECTCTACITRCPHYHWRNPLTSFQNVECIPAGTRMGTPHARVPQSIPSSVCWMFPEMRWSSGTKRLLTIRCYLVIISNSSIVTLYQLVM